MQTARMLADARRAMQRLATETVTYKPEGGSSRDLLAVVERAQPASIPESPRGGQHKNLTVHVVNDAASKADNDVGGIAVDELDTGGDAMEVYVREGAKNQTRSIARIARQDPGMLTVEVR